MKGKGRGEYQIDKEGKGEVKDGEEMGMQDKPKMQHIWQYGYASGWVYHPAPYIFTKIFSWATFPLLIAYRYVYHLKDQAQSVTSELAVARCGEYRSTPATHFTNSTLQRQSITPNLRDAGCHSFAYLCCTTRRGSWLGKTHHTITYSQPTQQNFTHSSELMGFRL